MSKVEGDWFSVATASDDMGWIQENGDLRLFVRSIEHLSNGSLRFNFRFKVQRQCVTVDVVCMKTRQNGAFSIAYKGENTVTILETDYNQQITLHMQNIRNGTKTQVLALYGRYPYLESSFLDKFKAICKKYGLSSKNIIEMTRLDDCF
nr:epididymal-specific lipocalin-9 [Microcebus murinus]